MLFHYFLTSLNIMEILTTQCSKTKSFNAGIMLIDSLCIVHPYYQMAVNSIVAWSHLLEAALKHLYLLNKKSEQTIRE